MRKQVIQYCVYGKSLVDAQEIGVQLGQLEGCIESGNFGWSAHAHFEAPNDMTQEMLPEGCRLVPESIADLTRRMEGK